MNSYEYYLEYFDKKKRETRNTIHKHLFGADSPLHIRVIDMHQNSIVIACTAFSIKFLLGKSLGSQLGAHYIIKYYSIPLSAMAQRFSIKVLNLTK